MVLNALAGDDSVVLDDTATTMFVNGGSGNDHFRIGQLYRNYTVTDPEFAIPAADFFTSSRGLLTNGVSAAATINGGTGDDMFDVFRNKATLTLNGDAGDDTFVVRSFVDESEVTRVDSGEGRDFITYATNAPVAIDGGDGYDTVIVIGTEFNDKYVVTADAVYGAGRFVTYTNVERLKVYGMEGNDTFYVLSTNPTVETSLYGGMGSDRSRSARRGVPVQSDDLQGHTGLVRHSVESSGGLTSKWRGVPVDGVAAEIQDNDAPAITVVPVGGSLVLREATSNVGQLRVRPTYKSNTQVEVTLSAPYDPSSTSRSQSVLLSLDGVHWSTSVTLVFGAGSTTAQLVYVKAAFDNSSEGRRQVPLQTRVVGRLSGTGPRPARCSRRPARSAPSRPTRSSAARSSSPAAPAPARPAPSSPAPPTR